MTVFAFGELRFRQWGKASQFLAGASILSWLEPPLGFFTFASFFCLQSVAVIYIVDTDERQSFPVAPEALACVCRLGPDVAPASAHPTDGPRLLLLAAPQMRQTHLPLRHRPTPRLLGPDA